MKLKSICQELPVCTVSSIFLFPSSTRSRSWSLHHWGCLQELSEQRKHQTKESIYLWIRLHFLFCVVAKNRLTHNIKLHFLYVGHYSSRRYIRQLHYSTESPLLGPAASRAPFASSIALRLASYSSFLAFHSLLLFRMPSSMGWICGWKRENSWREKSVSGKLLGSNHSDTWTSRSTTWAVVAQEVQHDLLAFIFSDPSCTKFHNQK